ncbi:MAG TPA: hypothetical protein VL137_17010 [Polyangiaceae bacterium]|nr:hypothetical protein [Polyangiaceae bacterium]
MSSPEPLSFRVEKLVPGGMGYARLANGKVALVSGVVPNDRIEVISGSEHKGHTEVTQWKLLEASAERVEPVCPVASRCGGCDWMMIAAQAQHAAKISLLKEALTRTGKFSELPEIAFVPSDNALGYRSRIRLQVSHSGAVGFFSQQSHELVEAERCAVATDAVNDALIRLRAISRLHPKALGAFAHVEIRSTPEGEVSLFFVRSPEERTQTIDSSNFFNALSSEFVVCTEQQQRDQSKWQRYALTPNISLKAPPGTFTQVNWQVNQRLIGQVVQGARSRQLGRFLELYCGSGNFTLPLLANGFSGLAVESGRQAIAAAKSAALEQTLNPETFLALDVGSFLASEVGKDARYDWLLIDPPRAGIKAGIEAVSQLAKRHIAICSCDPVTLARDLRRLVDLGFALESITAFDMFPQTHHVETLVWLKRAR